MREVQFRETSADTKRIKCNTNGIKPGSSKNIDLLKVKEDTTESSGATNSATLLLKSSKSLLHTREMENYYKLT